MKRLWLRARAPFAAYRWMQAGVYRATVPTMPPSAAHGLVLNLAGIESRDAAAGVATPMKPDVPRLRIAVGAIGDCEVASLYQQLHVYPVGASGKELRERAHGSKYWIAPARRELLVGLDVMLGVECPDDGLCERICRGLEGRLGGQRYGLPFAGDNNLLFDRIDVMPEPLAARWFVPVNAGERPRKGAARLTVGIDRLDSSKTTTVLMAPGVEAASVPPDAAWIWTPRAPG